MCVYTLEGFRISYRRMFQEIKIFIKVSLLSSIVVYLLTLISVVNSLAIVLMSLRNQYNNLILICFKQYAIDNATPMYPCGLKNIYIYLVYILKQCHLTIHL